MSVNKPVRPSRYSLGWIVVVGFLLGGCTPPPPQDNAPQTSQSSDEQQRKSLMQRVTRDVKDASKETSTAGAREAKPRLPETNVIRYPFDAALDVRGRVAKHQITAAVNSFYAFNGRYPKDYEEFKREIIDANPSLQLPALPYYQEYGYDAEKHELIILEYPDRKRSGR